MSTRRLLTSLGLALAAISCRDANSPTAVQAAPSPALASLTDGAGGSGIHILNESATAPQLDTYQVSFWAVKGKAASLKVKYKDLTLSSNGSPFLEFDIPRDGLDRAPNGRKLKVGDSLQISLTIDAATFKVDFQPSGLQFSSVAPATLQFWYQNANPDLNGDGVVDANDAALYPQLNIWYTSDAGSSWAQLLSQRDLNQKWVLAPIYHFSGYAVSW